VGFAANSRSPTPPGTENQSTNAFEHHKKTSSTYRGDFWGFGRLAQRDLGIFQGKARKKMEILCATRNAVAWAGAGIVLWVMVELW